jgi:transcription initiation factor IIE alpha subunit
MIDKGKRGNEILNILSWAINPEVFDVPKIIDTIITQEQSMIEKLEADKAELLEMLKQNKQYICELCKMNESFTCVCVRIARIDQLIQKMEK